MTEIEDLHEAIETDRQDVNVLCWLWRLSKRITDNTTKHIIQNMREVHELVSCRQEPPFMMDLAKEAGTCIAHWEVPEEGKSTSKSQDEYANRSLTNSNT